MLVAFGFLILDAVIVLAQAPIPALGVNDEQTGSRFAFWSPPNQPSHRVAGYSHQIPQSLGDLTWVTKATHPRAKIPGTPPPEVRRSHVTEEAVDEAMSSWGSSGRRQKRQWATEAESSKRQKARRASCRSSERREFR